MIKRTRKSQINRQTNSACYTLKLQIGLHLRLKLIRQQSSSCCIKYMSIFFHVNQSCWDEIDIQLVQPNRDIVIAVNVAILALEVGNYNIILLVVCVCELSKLYDEITYIVTYNISVNVSVLDLPRGHQMFTVFMK